MSNHGKLRFLFSGFDENNLKERMYQASWDSSTASLDSAEGISLLGKKVLWCLKLALAMIHT